MYLLLLKFESLKILFTQHFYRNSIQAVFMATGLRLIFLLGARHKWVRITTMATLLLVTCLYFGVDAIALLGTSFWASFLIGKIVFKGKEPVLGAAVGFFSLIQVYILLSLLFSPMVALGSIVALSITIIAIFNLRVRNRKRININTVIETLHRPLATLGVFEISLIILALMYGSLPQGAMSWDSVYANLYNAKWYIELNSVAPLQESISSIFPQQAIIYYAFFYAIGGLRALQLAYLLPLLLVFFVLKQLANKFNFSSWYEHGFKLLILVPIALAQASSGYYDLFIASMLLLTIYTIASKELTSNLSRSVASALFLGFAVASKFFAAILGPFLVLGLIWRVYKSFKSQKLIKSILLGLGLLILIFGPLSIWMLRSYQHTGSPIFPFFQTLFRTNALWSGASVEQNAMTQSTITTVGWLKGGFILYPILTYFRSEQFVEGTRGYPGIIYVILLPFQIILVAVSLWRVYKRKATVIELTYLMTILGFLGVGMVVRYYRYLWPFQLSLGVLTFVMLWPVIRRLKISLFFISLLLIYLYSLHAVDLAESFRFVPEQPKSNLFQPELLVSKSNDPIFGVINKSTNTKPILDASQYTPSRLYFKQRTFMCNWYWIAGDKKLVSLANESDQTAREFIQQFSFVLTSINPKYLGNYCQTLLERPAVQDLLTEISRGQEHIVYEVRLN